MPNPTSGDSLGRLSYFEVPLFIVARPSKAVQKSGKIGAEDSKAN